MTKTIAVYASLFLLAATSAAASVDTRYLYGLGDVRYHFVEAQEIGRGYHVYVMLPEGYDEDDNETFPTVYLLDGGALFPLMAAYSRYLNFAGEAPKAIYVGISYGSGDFRKGNNRSTDYTAKAEDRDYWGGAEPFQKFLAGQLLPLIEGTYRSQADRRIIFGQSIGGQFVLYTALTQPDLFWGHIASNPALHRNLPFFLQAHSKQAADPTASRLFVSSSTHDEPRFREPALEWMTYWSARDNNPWQLKTVNLEGHSHMSAPPASYRQGMQWLFSAE